MFINVYAARYSEILVIFKCYHSVVGVVVNRSTVKVVVVSGPLRRLLKSFLFRDALDCYCGEKTQGPGDALGLLL